MDLEAPSLEVSTKGMEEGPYDIGREDVEGKLLGELRREFFLTLSTALLEVMRQIEEETASPNFVNGGSHHPMRDTREALEKLVTRMDSLEADFDRLAEKSSE
jgi:autophagy-related protein 11